MTSQEAISAKIRSAKKKQEELIPIERSAQSKLVSTHAHRAHPVILNNIKWLLQHHPTPDDERNCGCGGGGSLLKINTDHTGELIVTTEYNDNISMSSHSAGYWRVDVISGPPLISGVQQTNGMCSDGADAIVATDLETPKPLLVLIVALAPLTLSMPPSTSIFDMYGME
ncbi:hypothetical protein CHS0354_000975 [Potamilus streckersoni]|uniref:Uncharacterized protein n=1 Tax=Potamilus streckersoni TaxID=2493646 RepID=A0AAE0SI01_9BIVA|nr:hypothetical protein CHS0354_000975 [Potamilus streckersoni]